MRLALEYQFLIPSHQHQGTLKTNNLTIPEDLLFTGTFCNLENGKINLTNPKIQYRAAELAGFNF
jgi:hypothetical protein